MNRVKRKKGSLILSDGTVYEGLVFGAQESVSAEVVFSTNMTGYTESLSDPSYRGQILVATYPIQGNYGLPAMSKDPQTDNLQFYESNELHPRGFVVYDYTEGYSHWNADYSLEEGMRLAGMVGLMGVDTRALTKKLRDSGSMMGKIIVEGSGDVEFSNYDNVNMVAQVSRKDVKEYGKGSKRVVLIDCGVKQNILRHLLKRDLTIVEVPWDYNFTDMDFDGLFIGNGPGNPMHCMKTVEHIRHTISKGIPTAGICMGNQLLALAIGAKVQKMKFGNRSHNQPVIMCGTTKCFITSQNHGFAVDDSNLPDGWHPYFRNLNDHTNEGLIHESGRFFSVQFHPEASGGPRDTSFIFDKFVDELKK